MTEAVLSNLIFILSDQFLLPQIPFFFSQQPSKEQLSHIHSMTGILESCCWRWKDFFFLFPPHMKIAAAYACAQHLSTAGLHCLSSEYTAIVSVFTLDALHRWLNGAVAVQFTLARNPEGKRRRGKQKRSWQTHFHRSDFDFSHHPEFSIRSENPSQAGLSCWEFYV